MPIHRIEVRSRADHADPRGDAARRNMESLGLRSVPRKVESTSVYFLAGLSDQRQLKRIAAELLADPVTEEATIGAAAARADALIEVHPLPGVMDPDAEAIQAAIHTMLGTAVEVRTGRRYDLHGVDPVAARHLVEQCLANTVIHAIHDAPYHPHEFRHGHAHDMSVRTVALREMDDAQLSALSRDAHLFLSLPEMCAIRDEYERQGRDPREIELETLAQTWSEHCVHKTLKATIAYRETSGGMSLPGQGSVADRPGHTVDADGTVTIHNLLKSTVAAATHELMNDGIDWCLSVFVDNAGVIAFDDEYAVCFKCETHNHPSAIEPYGGAATGIGGCIRDVIGTGLAARPIASTDIFCVAHPDQWEHATVPRGCLHPKRILTQVVAGVRDYGNRMGIPTVNGAVWFDDDYIGNPLVYCGCIGVMPRNRVAGDAQVGDRIIALGGRTGRDGIHGATFSSAELTDAHADEFSHAVQIGNPMTEKKLLDAILQARDREDGCLFSAITDCGAGGFSSAVGEMGQQIGAVVHLEKAPLKYAGLTPTEIWISEAQERMVLSVPAANIESLRTICDRHDVELCELGTFGAEDRALILSYDGAEVGRLSMEFLHDGIPGATREAVWTPPTVAVADESTSAGAPSLADALLTLLAHPNIASKRWIIRQYDHEVQGASVVKPLVGPDGEGPSDAAVILPVAGSTRGLAIANGLATGLRDDPYVMTLAAIDECVRNLVCVGADPNRIAILDNFCWPSCDDPRNLGQLVRAAEACYDGAKAYRAPFISGKDSLNNQFTTEDGHTIQIPPTLLISGIGIVPDANRCVTMDAKAAGNVLVLVGPSVTTLRGSHYEMSFPGRLGGNLPATDLDLGPRAATTVHGLIAAGLVRSAHDCSDGGLLIAAAEMAIGGGLGVDLSVDADALACFGEGSSRYLLEVESGDIDEVRGMLGDVPHAVVGEVRDSTRLTVGNALELSVEEMKAAWLGALDW